MSNPFGRDASAKAVLLVSGSTYFGLLFGLIVSATIARAVGPEQFGQYAYAVWISTVFVMVANNGLNTTGIRFISECLGRGDQGSASAVHHWLLRLQYVSLVATIAVILITLPLTLPASWSGHITLFAAVVLVSVIAKVFYLFNISVAKGHGRYSIEALSSLAMSAVNMICVLVLAILHATLSTYLWLFAIMSVTSAVVVWALLRRQQISARKTPLTPEVMARLKDHLVWTVVLTIAAALGNKSSETYLLGTYAGPADVGYFAIAASLIQGGAALVSTGLNAILMPVMGYSFGAGGAQRVNAILTAAVRYFVFAGLLLAGVGFLWADPIIQLIYGAQYEPAARVLQVMALVAGATLSQGAFVTLLSTTDKQRVRALVAVASVALSVGAAIWLVPRYGLDGAVVSHAASSTVIFLLIVIGIGRGYSVTLPWRELSRLGLAAALAATLASGCLWLATHPLLQIAAGVVYVLVFIAGSIVCKAWNEEDLTPIMPLAERSPRLVGRALPTVAAWLRR
jgi:O-antigen/teichoic acid export membrane protein